MNVWLSNSSFVTADRNCGTLLYLRRVVRGVEVREWISACECASERQGEAQAETGRDRDRRRHDVLCEILQCQWVKPPGEICV